MKSSRFTIPIAFSLTAFLSLAGCSSNSPTTATAAVVVEIWDTGSDWGDDFFDVLIDGITVIDSTSSGVTSRITTVSLEVGAHTLSIVRARGPDGTYAIRLKGASRPSGATQVYGRIGLMGGSHQFEINVP